ncbi:MAG TPA: hypothetical protein VGC44_06720, partial [Longimicrobiales bacterium]
MADDFSDEKRRIARTLVSLRFPIDNPAFDVSAALDETVERISLADFYNGPAATWVRLNTRWQWLPLDHSELDDVVSIRDLGKLCFAHLALKAP